MVESKTLQSTSGTSRGSGCLCQLSDVHQQRLVGILTNLFSLTRLLQLDWPSFTLEGCSLLQGPPKNCTCSQQHTHMAGLPVARSCISVVSPSRNWPFWHRLSLGDGSSERSSSSTPILRSQENGPSFADAPSSICSLFSLQSSKQLPRSGLREFLDYELPQGIFHLSCSHRYLPDGQSS